MEKIKITLLMGCICILAIACSSNTQIPSRISVDKQITVALYPANDSDLSGYPLSQCLLKDTVHISELLQYPGDEGITMPFSFSDSLKFAEITEQNLKKRIAISINGKVMSCPVVKMRIDNGACSVVLDESQAKAIFPDVNLDHFKH